MAKIAHRHGLSDWTLVWNASENEALRKKRKDPNVLLPGDALVLPGIEIYEIARASDAPHRIELRTRAETKLRLRLQDIDHEALADVEYELSFTLAGRLTLRPGRAPTDASGWLEELLPLHARDVTLHLRKPALSLPVALGELDPLQDEESKKPHPSGVAQRLAALGYAPGWSSDRVGLLAFQSDELDEAARDGALNAKTMGTLQELYGA